VPNIMPLCSPREGPRCGSVAAGVRMRDDVVDNISISGIVLSNAILIMKGDEMWMS
jgi:hypothetical protein